MLHLIQPVGVNTRFGPLLNCLPLWHSSLWKKLFYTSEVVLLATDIVSPSIFSWVWSSLAVYARWSASILRWLIRNIGGKLARFEREWENAEEAVSWSGAACLSSLLSSSSDSVACEPLKSFNYQQLLGIHWMHGKLMVGCKGGGNERG